MAYLLKLHYYVVKLINDFMVNVLKDIHEGDRPALVILSGAAIFTVAVAIAGASDYFRERLQRVLGPQSGISRISSVEPSKAIVSASVPATSPVQIAGPSVKSVPAPSLSAYAHPPIAPPPSPNLAAMRQLHDALSEKFGYDSLPADIDGDGSVDAFPSGSIHGNIDGQTIFLNRSDVSGQGPNLRSSIQYRSGKFVIHFYRGEGYKVLDFAHPVLSGVTDPNMLGFILQSPMLFGEFHFDSHEDLANGLSDIYSDLEIYENDYRLDLLRLLDRYSSKINAQPDNKQALMGMLTVDVINLRKAFVARLKDRFIGHFNSTFL